MGNVYNCEEAGKEKGMNEHFKDPEVLGDYEILARLGQYPPVYTYLAQPKGTAGQKYVIKHFDTSWVKDDPRGIDLLDIKMFVAEIFFIYKAGISGTCKATESKDFWIAFEFVPGMTLQKSVNYNGPMTPEQALSICAKIGAVLAETEELPALHLALNPKNVYISRDGDVTIKGWLQTENNLSFFNAPQKLVYDPYWFQAPELLDLKGVSSSADIYSLGLIACYLVTGDWEVKNKIKEGLVLPSQLEPVVKGMLAEDPTQRISTWPDALNVFASKTKSRLGLLDEIFGRSGDVSRPDPETRTSLATKEEAAVGETALFIDRGEEQTEQGYELDTDKEREEPEEETVVGEKPEIDEDLEEINQPETAGAVEAKEEAHGGLTEDETEGEENPESTSPQDTDEALEDIFEPKDEDVSTGKEKAEDESEARRSFFSFIPHDRGKKETGAGRVAAMTQTTSARRLDNALENKTLVVTIISLFVVAVVAISIGFATTMRSTPGPKAQTIALPSFLGMSKDQAAQEADALGVTLSTGETFSADVPAGQVISQTPDESTELTEGMICNLVLSKGPEPVAEDTAPAGVDVAAVNAADGQAATGTQPAGDSTATTPPPASAHGKPHVSVSASPSSGSSSGVMVSLSASASVEGGSIVSYSWSCGGSGPHISREFTSSVAPTTVTVTCTVTDEQGQTATASTTIRLY